MEPANQFADYTKAPNIKAHTDLQISPGQVCARACVCVCVCACVCACVFACVSV
jgi:hypothetical protein